MFRLWMSFIVVLLLEKKNSMREKLAVQNIDGFGYELIQFELECLKSRFSERFGQLKKFMEVTQQQLNDNVERKIIQLENGIATSIGNKVSQISDQISNIQNSFSERYDQLEKQVGRVQEAQKQFNDNVERKITQLEKGIEASLGDKVFQISDQISKMQDILLDRTCQEIPKETGLCLMDIDGIKTMVYQVHRFDVDWFTVLQRSNGSVNFHRNWTDYRDGFGTAGQEFWLGLERLHVLTKNDLYELAVELEDFAGHYEYARYDNFSIGPEKDLYRLNVLGKYSGTAGDSFGVHKDYVFSTSDKGPNTDFVKRLTGGWWYNVSMSSRLTGLWKCTHRWKALFWLSFDSAEITTIKFARMLIRKFNSQNVV